MKRITTLGCLALSVSAFAQQKVITGSVIEPKGGAITIAPKYIKPMLDSNNTYITSENFDVIDRKDGKKYTVSSPLKQAKVFDNTPVTTGFTAVTLNGINGAVLLTPTKKEDYPAEVKPVNTQPAQQQGKFLNLIDNNKQATPPPALAPVETIDPTASQSDEVPSLLTPVVKPINAPQNARTNTESIDPSLIPSIPNKKTSSLDLTGTGAKGYAMPALETIDPAFLQPKNNNTTATTVNNTKTTVMPELAAIEGGAKPSGNYNRSGMPELAAIEGGYKPASQSGMPALAPIEGGYNPNASNQKTMPELAAIEGTATGQNATYGMVALAPIEGQDNYYQQQPANPQPQKTNYNPNAPRGFTLNKGTILAAQDRVTYVVKPVTPQLAPKTTTPNQEVVYYNYKPGAGGGSLMPELAAIEPMTSTQTFGNNMPALAPIEGNVEKREIMPALALIEQQTVATQYYNAQQPAPKLAPANAGANYNQQYNRPTATTQPCACPVPKKKKWYPPKKKYVYRPPVQQEIRYVERPSQTIVYVPVQQQQQTNPPTPPKQEVVYQPPVQQQPKDNFTYRDYTNTYKKEEPRNTCNCGTQQSQPKPSVFTKSEDPSVYYDPSKYSGVSAGPTSGDYPVNPTQYAADAGLRYTFYVNRKGEYSVGVFNSLANVLVSQDGKVIEYKINQAQDQYNTPKTNYFGSVDNIAGIPITYNYNRSVNRIGNVDFTYDFEGFIKTIGGNQVLYNNRSKLAQVGNVHVTYSGNTVTGVTPNNGLVYFTNN